MHKNIEAPLAVEPENLQQLHPKKAKKILPELVRMISQHPGKCLYQ
jgi:ABC-type antimicrobial peptide transport system ATPase subunit